MGYKKVTKEEFEQYIKSNPNGAYRVNGQEVVPEKTYEDEEGQDWFMKLLTGITKPLRAIPGSVAGAISGKEDYDNPFLTQREEESFGEDPTKWGTKQAAGLGAYLVPGGSNVASVGGRIAGAAAKGAGAGALGGFSVSDDEGELESILKGAGLGGLVGGTLQGVGEISKGIKSAKLSKASSGEMDIYLDSLDDVKKIGNLPDKARKNLKTLSNSAGFNDTKLSDSKNILNYLNNRKLAGTTPGQTLENMTQEFANASQLKQEGIEEIGGLSRDYLKQAKNSFDEAITNKGLITNPESKTVYKNIIDVFEKGPQGAKELDDIIMKWNEAGRLAKGAQKTSLNGLYVDAQKALRDTLRSTNVGGKYDTALQSLSQILGLDDAGVVSASASMAEKSGVNIPMFQNAGFTGTDVKMPFIANTISKGQAGLAQGQLAKNLPISAGQQGAGEIPAYLQKMLSIGQQVGSPMAGQLGGQLTGQSQQVQPQGYAQQEQGVAPEAQAMQAAMAQAIYSGQITVAEAEAIMGYLGISGGTAGAMPKTDSGRKAMVARDSAKQALVMLDQDPSVAGKLQGLENIFYDVTGQANAATGYKTMVEGIRSQVFNALGGTALSPTEKKQYEKFLPKMSDSKEQAQQKLRILIPMMESLMGTEVDTPTPMQYGEQQY